MSADSTFIARWSRLKQQAAKEKRRPPRGASPETSAEDRSAPADAGRPPAAKGQPADVPKPVEADPPFDVASLPPIESIVAGTDIRPFLQKGVPGALTKAALRRAWTADPAIRDFIEVAENQWDFTDPTAIPGFGPLQAGDNVRELVDQALGKLARTATAEPAAGGTEAAEALPESSQTTAVAQPAAQQDGAPSPVRPGKLDTADVAALQHDAAAPAVGNAPRRKAHGRALPR